MRASVIFAPHFVHGASIRRSRNKVGAGGEASMNALQTKWSHQKYMLDQIEELIWVNVSAQRTQSLRICPMSALCPEPDFADMFDLGQRADVCWPACLVQACHLQSAIHCHLTQ